MKKETEEILTRKILNVVETYQNRNMKHESNRVTFVEAIIGAVRNAVKREVNVRLHEAKVKARRKKDG
jgi:hypothetical protein